VNVDHFLQTCADIEEALTLEAYMSSRGTTSDPNVGGQVLESRRPRAHPASLAGVALDTAGMHPASEAMRRHQERLVMRQVRQRASSRGTASGAGRQFLESVIVGAFIVGLVMTGAASQLRRRFTAFREG